VVDVGGDGNQPTGTLPDEVFLPSSQSGGEDNTFTCPSSQKAPVKESVLEPDLLPESAS
jgi:hypothetical protein